MTVEPPRELAASQELRPPNTQKTGDFWRGELREPVPEWSSARGPSAALRAAFAAFALWTLAFALACNLTSGPLGEGHAGVSAAERLLGSGRMLLGEGLYMKADEYFHKGVPHKSRAAFSDVFQSLREQVAPTQHKHTELNEVGETMPWLSLAVLADDRNVEAANVAAFWLLKSGHPDLAEKALLQVASRNPDDYRPMIELARVYLVRRAFDRAASVLDAGIGKWPHPFSGTDRDAMYDLSWLLDFRAALHEREGNASSALPLLERQMAIFPERAGLAAHVEKIRRGAIDMAEVNRRLEDLFGGEPAKCDREEDGEHDHDHDHVPHG